MICNIWILGNLAQRDFPDFRPSVHAYRIFLLAIPPAIVAAVNHKVEAASMTCEYWQQATSGSV